MRQRKKEEMYPLVKKWQTSGQSKLKFSEEHGLKVHTFHYWVKKYEKVQFLKVETAEAEKFIPLSVKIPDRPSSPPSELRLCYPNGVSLQVPIEVSMTYLTDLIKLGKNV